MFNLRLGLRSLSKTPVVTTIAALSMALGIGANVAIFSIFSQLLLRPLPVDDPGDLVTLVSPGPRSGAVSCGGEGNCDSVFSYPMFRDLERAQTVFTGIAAHRSFGVSVASGGTAEGGDAALVSGSYFPVLGVRPALGRLLAPSDEREAGGGSVVVISHDLWRRRFAMSRDVLDQPLMLNGHTLTIVGVAPQDFHGTTLGARPLAYVPISMREVLVPRWKGLDDRRSYWAYLFARLKPGTTVEQARETINATYRAIHTTVDVPLQQGMRPSLLEQFRAMTLNLEPGGYGQSDLRGDVRQPLTLLFGVTIIVLLICCANMANLLLARAATRTTEMAVRLSIGAARRHLIAQVLTESLLLSGLGGAAGLVVAQWMLTGMIAVLPSGRGELLSVQLDIRLLWFAAAVSVVTGLVFGLVPALHATRPDLVTALKASAGQPAGAKTAARFRVVLATAQVALSMLLLVAAGLFIKSLTNIARVDLGLDRERLVVFGVAPDLNGYPPDRMRAVYERIEGALSSFPGVTGVTASKVRLADGDNYSSNFTVQGFTPNPDADTDAMYNYVGPAFFRTLGVSLLSGREFGPSDISGMPKVAIVNEAFAKKFGLERGVVGVRMRRGRAGGDLDVEIVGLVRNSIYSEVKGVTPPVVAFPYRQDGNLGSMTFYARTAGSEDELLAAIPRIVSGIDPTLPIHDLRSMSAQLQDNVSLDRFVTLLSAAFAGVATVLAALGLYGVLAYLVTQRMREFGLRMALGAGAANVRALVLGQVALMLGAGAAIGIASALAFGRAAESLLFRMKAADPLVFTAAAFVLFIVGLSAGYIPARRASRVDPMTALRYE